MIVYFVYAFENKVDQWYESNSCGRLNNALYIEEIGGVDRVS